jgi:hypothetical protein
VIYYQHDAGFPDTPPETERVLFAMLHEMPPWRSRDGRTTQSSRTRIGVGRAATRYPNASQDELHRRLADIVLGGELAARLRASA